MKQTINRLSKADKRYVRSFCRRWERRGNGKVLADGNFFNRFQIENTQTRQASPHYVLKTMTPPRGLTIIPPPWHTEGFRLFYLPGLSNP